MTQTDVKKRHWLDLPHVTNSSVNLLFLVVIFVIFMDAELGSIAVLKPVYWAKSQSIFIAADALLSARTSAMVLIIPDLCPLLRKCFHPRHAIAVQWLKIQI